jgi:DNA-binding MarR family transcriptional regulator
VRDGKRAFDLESIAGHGTATELRAMAERIHAIAERLEGAGPFPVIRRAAATPERRIPQLASLAELEYRQRRARGSFLPAELLGEPAWDILLDLLVQHASGTRISVTSACLASGVPTSTALRWIAALEAHGFVQRVPSHFDRRVNYIELTAEGLRVLDRCLAARLGTQERES